MISILTRPNIRGRADLPRLRRRLRRLLKLLDFENAEVCLLLTDDEEIQGLNRDYRDKDQPTDVLSFSQYEDDPFMPAELNTVLGDVVISVPTAQRQVHDGCLPRITTALKNASKTDSVPANWMLDDELTFLMVHGVLHLLGHDHIEPEDAEEMFRLEEAILPILLSHRGRGKSASGGL
jgi:probable rRNA maturation factor